MDFGFSNSGFEPGYGVLIAVFCFSGAYYAAELFARAQHESGAAGSIWTFWSALVCAGTIWLSYILALVTFASQEPSGFELPVSLLALGIATMGLMSGFWISRQNSLRLAPELSGGLIALSVLATAVLQGSSHVAPRFTNPSALEAPLPVIAAFLVCAIGMSLSKRLVAPKSRILFASAVTATAVLLFLAAAAPIPSPPAPIGISADLIGSTDMVLIGGVVTTLFVVFALIGSALDRHRKDTARRTYNHLAQQDALTHLPNRHYVQRAAKDLLGAAESNKTVCAVVMISLDQFKTINDLHGYEAGDAALCGIAEILRKNLPAPILLSRFYSDEFLIINSKLETVDEAVEFARQVRALARRPLKWGNCRLSIRSSIGLSIYPRDGSDLNTLVKRASLAAKQAKSIGGNLIQPYVTGMEEANRWEATLAADLRNATIDNELTLVFQRQNLAKSGHLVGYEALVRWRHTEKGPIAPEDFIPMAERSGIILDIGSWVLENACAEAATWHDPVTLSVNASPVQLSRSDFAGLVSTVLLKTGLPAERLEIELTESTPIDDHERVHETIRTLRKMGVRVAMDDFGTGYSSLNTLQAFPFDKIKVDRMFTQSLETNPQSRAILRSAILLGHSFKIPVIAEGVETERQLKFLQEAGCREVQGFLFGKHLVPEQIRKLREGGLTSA